MMFEYFRGFEMIIGDDIDLRRIQAAAKIAAASHVNPGSMSSIVLHPPELVFSGVRVRYRYHDTTGEVEMRWETLRELLRTSNA